MAKVKEILVKTKNAGTVKVLGGRMVQAPEGLKGFKPEEEFVAFRNNERIRFKYKGNKHVEDGHETIMHVLDAAIAQALGKGEVVGDPIPVPDKK